MDEFALAQAFLELAKNTFAEFSGREPDNTSDIPTLSTVVLYIPKANVLALECFGVVGMKEAVISKSLFRFRLCSMC